MRIQVLSSVLLIMIIINVCSSLTVPLPDIAQAQKDAEFNKKLEKLNELDHLISQIEEQKYMLRTLDNIDLYQTEQEISKISFANASPVLNPKVVIFGGGSTTGKTTFKSQLSKDVFTDTNFVDISTDEVMYSFPEFRQGVQKGDRMIAQKLNPRASVIVQALFHQAVGMHFNILYDGTMSNFNRTMDTLETLKAAGYTIHMIGLMRDLKECATSAIHRGKLIGRWISLEAILMTHIGYTQNFQSYLLYGDTVQLYDSQPNFVLVKFYEANKAGIIFKDDKLFTKFLNFQFFTMHDYLKVVLPEDKFYYNTLEAITEKTFHFIKGNNLNSFSVKENLDARFQGTNKGQQYIYGAMSFPLVEKDPLFQTKYYIGIKLLQLVPTNGQLLFGFYDKTMATPFTDPTKAVFKNVLEGLNIVFNHDVIEIRYKPFKRIFMITLIGQNNQQLVHSAEIPKTILDTSELNFFIGFENSEYEIQFIDASKSQTSVSVTPAPVPVPKPDAVPVPKPVPVPVPK